MTLIVFILTLMNQFLTSIIGTMYFRDINNTTKPYLMLNILVNIMTCLHKPIKFNVSCCISYILINEDTILVEDIGNEMIVV